MSIKYVKNIQENYPYKVLCIKKWFLYIHKIITPAAFPFKYYIQNMQLNIQERIQSSQPVIETKAQEWTYNNAFSKHE